jgi:uncharacterized protein YgiM (DUF1202 family)
MMSGRAFLPLFFLLLVSCAPVIKSLEPTMTPTIGVPTLTASPAPSATPEPVIVYVTATSLHVRVRPGEQNTVIGYLYHADVVRLSGKCQAGWAQISWGGTVAWVKAKYLSGKVCQTNEEE